MTRYLIEGVMSPQSCMTMAQNPHDRMVVLQPIMERIGMRIEAYYFAVGNGRHYVIVESPEPADLTTLEAMWLTQYAAGAVTSLTILPVLTSAEAVEAFKKVGDLGYRPPAA